MRRPAPLTLLTGFLGAGKTTLLNRILRDADGRLGVLVNDFGSIDIDGRLVESVDEDTVRFAGGCMCCEISDGVEAGVTRLLERPDGPSHVLLEASGVADPFAVARQVHALAPLVAVDAVIAVVDAAGLLRTRLPDGSADWTSLVLDQIMAADVVVLNKVDLVEPPELERAEAIVRRAVRRARVLHAVHADVPIELLLDGGGTAALASAAHRHHDPPFQSWSFTSDTPLSDPALRRAIAALPTAVIRGKGIVRLAGTDQPSVFQLVGSSAFLHPGGRWDGPPRTELVLIGTKGSLNEANLRKVFEACHST